MVRRSRRISILVTLAVAISLFGSTFALGSTGNSDNAASQGPPTHVASAFGRANIAGQETFVHVTVASVSAESAKAAARAELARRGAVPVQSAEYTGATSTAGSRPITAVWRCPPGWLKSC